MVGGVDTISDVYTVPVGHRIILKNVHVSNPGAATKTARSYVKPSHMLTTAQVVANGANDQIIWVVLNPGEVLQVLQQNAATIFYVLSGYLLYI